MTEGKPLVQENFGIGCPVAGKRPSLGMTRVRPIERAIQNARHADPCRTEPLERKLIPFPW